MNGPILTETDYTALLEHKNKTVSTMERRQSTDFWMDGVTHGEVHTDPQSMKILESTTHAFRCHFLRVDINSTAT